MQALYPSVDHCDCTPFCHHGLTHKFTTEQAKRALHQSQCQIISLELVNESSLSAKATREIQFEDSRRRAAAAEEEAVAQRASAERLAAATATLNVAHDTPALGARMEALIARRDNLG